MLHTIYAKVASYFLVNIVNYIYETEIDY